MHERRLDRAGWQRVGRRLLLGFLIAGTAVACTQGENENSISVSGAHQLCDQAIKTTSLNPEHVEVPYKAPRETVKVLSFVWRIGDGLMIPDQLGAQVDTAAICRVSKEHRDVVYLEISGEAVPSR